MAKPRANYSKYLELLKKVAVGDSFFEPGATTKSLYFLRQVASRAGIRISMHRVECDSVYQKAGVRVWREPDKVKDDDL